MPSDKSILIIAGPTAVGKTDASLLLSQEYGAEIVSADSMQIYRGMDIGTAKPTREQRSLVYHHMIDIVDPGQPYSVGDYLRDARSAIDGIIASGGVPLVVGGTGMYIRALTRGLFYGPPADLELRGRLIQREALEGQRALYTELARVDPDAAVTIHPNDLRRTVRALEVYYVKKNPISHYQREHGFQDKPYEFRLLFLTRDRRELYGRIEDRVDGMMKEGFEGEVRGLFEQGYREDLPSMQGLGYKHFLDHFKGRCSRDDALSRMKRDTKRYAKRQFTWFRREPDTAWIDITGLTETRKIVQKIKKGIEISGTLG